MILALLSFWMLDATAQTYTMGTSGSQNITTCSAWIYDDGGSSGSYSNSCQATMIIHAASGTTIGIDQGTYYTETSFDYVKIYEGAGTTGTLLAQLEGQGTITVPIVSTTGTLTVEFHSDGSVQYDGFALHLSCSSTPVLTHNMPTSGSQTISACDEWIYDCGGPSGDYSNSSDATLIINPANATDVIIIDQGSYNTESCCDYLKIYDGVGTGGNLLATWQGQGTLVAPISSTNGPITLQFHSDGSVIYSGFQLHVTCSSEPIDIHDNNMPVSGSRTIEICDEWVYDCGGPSGDYSNSSDATMIINPANASEMVTIDIGSYYTESCCDYLKIYDGVGTGGTLLATWQGQGTLAAPIVSLTGSITLQFHSDGSVVNTGFQLHVSCSPAPSSEIMSNEPLTTCNARWTDPGGYDNYGNNQNITQTICSDNGDHLLVSFLNFALSSGDNLYVYDGNSITAPLIGTYTGTTLPPDILSGGSCLTFRFVSNSSGVNAGWLAMISCQSCASSPVSIAEGSPCAFNGANPFCTDENPYGVTYPSGTGSSDATSTFFNTSGRIGCLYTTPRPAWYYMRINEPGNLLIYIEQMSASGGGLDVDFACWGPFTAANQSEFMNNLCCGLYNFTTDYIDSHRPTNGNHNGDMGGYPLGNLVDCSYSGSATEWCYIPNAQEGQFYLLLITNYNGSAGTITFTPVASSSTATTDCSLLAQVTNDGPYCEGDTIHLSCQDPEPGATYAWTGPNGWTSNAQNPTIATATLAMSGDYSLVKHLGGQSSPAAVTTVVVNANPVITLSTNRDTVCDNQSATITASGGNMYVWNNGQGGASITVEPTTSQLYTVTVTTAGNCHGVDSIYLVAAPTAVTHLRDTICVGDGYNNYGFTLTPESTTDGVSRTLQALYATRMGCDSTVTLDLAFYPQPSTEFSITQCDTYTWNSQTYTQSGDYIQHFQTIHGCDSMVTLHLTINYSDSTEFSITQCDSYTWNTQTYTQTGDYVQQFQTIHGCDSTVTLHLTINPSLPTQFSVTECSSYTWNSQTYTQSGDYQQQFQTIHGCDSIVTLHLTINPVMNYNFSATQCESYTWNDSIYTQSGDYVQHFLTPQGCDSTVTLHLTINYDVETEWQHTQCDSYTWNTQTYTESGDYVQQFQTIHGCDSTVTLHLVIDSSKTNEFDTISCDSYTWNNQTYTESGNFVQHLQTVHGCDSAVTMHLTIDKLVVSTHELLPEHCGHADGGITLHVSQSVGPVTFNWGNLPNANQASASNLAAGNYMVSIADSTCSMDYPFQIFVAPMPRACFNVLPMSESVSMGTMMQFLDCSQNATDWYWDMGNGDYFNTRSVDYIYPAVGYYTVTLIVNDEFGCADTTSGDVKIREEMRFYVPNSFSPNGDGLNDVFLPVGSEVSEEGYTLCIYDRWGGLIFMTHNLHQGWDGTVKGRRVEGGSVMHYVIFYQNMDGRQFVKDGVLHVL